MAGTETRKSRDYDAFKRWGKRVTDLAERLGWERVELWKHFSEFTRLAEYELGLPTYAAEDTGYRLLRGMFDKLAVANETDGWCM